MSEKPDLKPGMYFLPYPEIMPPAIVTSEVAMLKLLDGRQFGTIHGYYYCGDNDFETDGRGGVRYFCRDGTKSVAGFLPCLTWPLFYYAGPILEER